MNAKSRPVEKVSIGIHGFDQISYGGLPEHRTTLIAGTVGSGKTIFAAQFLADGIQHANENGVFVTFEEYPGEIRRNLASFGWNIGSWEAEGKWLFVDASPQTDETVVFGAYNLAALLARIEHAIAKVNAKRIAMDSLGAVLSQFSDQSLVRRELFRIISAFRKNNITAIITTERTEEPGGITRYDIGEFVADNVILLHNTPEEETRRRTIEILKFRGANHQKRQFFFSILPNKGIEIIPLPASELAQRSSDVRITSGNEKLDVLCRGGIFRDSITLVSGPSGTGKTLMATQFMGVCAGTGERSLLFGYEESHDQLLRNARGWDIDFERAEKEGKLKIICLYPEEATLEEHLIAIKKAIDDFKPSRLAIDSLSALERISSIRSFRIFIVGLTSFVKERQICALFTTTTGSLVGGTSITEARISTLADIIVLLRYVEIKGSMQRALTILKMRGSDHDKGISGFTIDGRGMHIGDPISNVIGILSGNFRAARNDESEFPGSMEGER